jgi:hypothetical protein
MFTVGANETGPYRSLKEESPNLDGKRALISIEVRTED